VTGETISHYRILEKLGEGGMGVVYRAEDLKLHRTVALKFAAPAKAGDEDVRRRFLREARSAAALTHPNICVVHEVDEDHGFISMEYLAGETVAAKAGRGPLPVSEAIEIAIQAGLGLQAAHEKGIVHRDVKSANLMVTAHGQVKVMDFGLAAVDTIGDADTTRTRLTQEGVVLGTPAYMSPEQALGKGSDRRSDIWSLGVVLYEMLGGRLPFRGPTAVAVLHSILHEAPAPLTGVPAGVGNVLAKALAKDPAERYQQMAEMLADLRAPERARRKPRVRRKLVAACGAVALAILASVWAARRWWEPAAPARASFKQLTEQAGQELYPSLSPDGNAFAYASRAAGNWDIYFQRVGGSNAINLTRDSAADDTQPAFSPDGQWIAFRSERAGGGIFVMGATGESVRKLSDAGYFPAWSPDGKKILYSTVSFERPEGRGMVTSQIFVLDASTGERTLLTAGMSDAIQAQWSPHGHRIAFFSQNTSAARDVWTMSATGQDRRPVTSDAALDWNPVWSPDGKYLYFASDRGGAMNLWRVRIEERTGKVLGKPEPSSTPSSYSAYLSFSRDGRRGLYAHMSTLSNLSSVAFDPVRGVAVGEPSAVTRGSLVAMTPEVSPDGQWLAFHGGERQDKLYLARTNGREMRRLTEDRWTDRVPRWSPDGQWIAFMSNRTGTFQIWAIRPDGSGLRQISNDESCRYPVWSPDGKRLAYNKGTGGSFLIEFDKPPSEQKPVRVRVEIEQGGRFGVADWSRDGRRLLGHMRRADGTSKGIGIYSLASGSFEQVSQMGFLPRWLADDRRVLFWHQGRVHLVDRRSSAPREAFSMPGVQIEQNFDISRDNRRIYFSVPTNEADVWLLEWAAR
jgi:Tol biopolymer transport system component